MTVEIKKTAEETTVLIGGRLDANTAPEPDKVLTEDIADTRNLVLDMKGVEYISGAGLRIILSEQKRMQKIGVMKIINVSEMVMEVFELTGFTDIMIIE